MAPPPSVWPRRKATRVSVRVIHMQVEEGKSGGLRVRLSESVSMGVSVSVSMGVSVSVSVSMGVGLSVSVSYANGHGDMLPSGYSGY